MTALSGHNPLERPPLGVMPQRLWQLNTANRAGKDVRDARRQLVRSAVRRYREAGRPVPGEWLEELESS